MLPLVVRSLALGSAAVAALGAASEGVCRANDPGTCQDSVLLQRGASFQRHAVLVADAPITANVYERVGGVGEWGGWCTCPDGQRYNVGDRGDACANGGASLACVGGVPEQCERVIDQTRAGMQVTCAPAATVQETTSEEITTTPEAGVEQATTEEAATTTEATTNTPGPECQPPSSWPNVDGGVTCEPCTALVLTDPYGHRCDKYCESFGQVCAGAAEEVNENCAVKQRYECHQPIWGTSDMLCTCKYAAAMQSPTQEPEETRRQWLPSWPRKVWQTSGRILGTGWCKAEEPADTWNLFTACGNDIPVKVLSYNLYWWNLFDRRKGNDRSAGRLIEANGPFDIMGFQECDSIGRVMDDARLQGTHEGIQGPHALGMAYRKDVWELISRGEEDIAEDRWEQHFGKRAVMWVKLRHRQAGKILFFMNHHGPLPVNTGGVCGGSATAANVLRLLAEHALGSDLKVLVGDLNADDNSETQRSLSARIRRVMYHWVDAIFSDCPAQETRNLGSGGSDHDAISATIRM